MNNLKKKKKKRDQADVKIFTERFLSSIDAFYAEESSGFGWRPGTPPTEAERKKKNNLQRELRSNYLLGKQKEDKTMNEALGREERKNAL